MTYPDEAILNLERGLGSGEPSIAGAALALICVTIGFEAEHPDSLYVFLLACESIEMAIDSIDAPGGDPAQRRSYLTGCLESAGISHLFERVVVA